jgi:membrane-associated phospholipid phosphatase
VLTATTALATGAMLLLGPVDDARWQGGILFDKAVRNEFRATSPSTTQTFRTIGDYTYHLSPLLPLIDVVVVAALARGDRKLAVNLGMILLEAYSYTGFSYFASTEIAARARPDSHCNEPGGTCDTQSFFGGHAAISATGAGLVCANHTRIALWGDPIADTAACVLAASNALLTASTRVVADRHYASDVIVGASLGFGFGYAVPVLLHYSYGKADRSLSFAPMPSCGPNCIGVRGTF